MASRHISAILWTLVSVNVLTLVLGGLITWLGYAIPTRLRQLGLLPELIIIAGFASLTLACMGLCALNYSSHLALNVYGAFCAIFMLLLLMGIPESWYKSDYFMDGSTSLDIIYFSLLALLIILLVFAFTFAHYLRLQETTPDQQRTEYNSSECNCVLNHCDPLTEYNSMAKKRWPTTTSAAISRRSNFLEQMNASKRYNQDYQSDDFYKQSMQTDDPFLNGNLQCIRSANNLFPLDRTAITLDTDRGYSDQSVRTAPPLIHKGFYQRDPNVMMVKAKSFTRLSNENEPQLETHEDWNLKNEYNSIPSNHYNSSTLAHCRCNIKDPLVSRRLERSLVGATRHLKSAPTPYSDLSIASLHSMRQPVRSRIKGSSSVVATTAAATATLLGGFTDINTSSMEPYADDAGSFSGVDLDAKDECDFGTIDQQLDASMLNQASIKSYHGGSYRRSTFKLATE